MGKKLPASLIFIESAHLRDEFLKKLLETK
jgi:hypothetical protein